MIAEAEEIIQFGEWECDINDYHAETRYVSASAMEVFRSSPSLYHARFIEKSLPLVQPTASMRLGSALHCLVLEPDVFEETYTVAPSCDRRTKEGKAAWAAFEASNNGKTLLSADERESVHFMAESILRHGKARQILEAESKREFSVKFPMEYVPCKTRFDLVIPGLIVDLKTATDPSPDGWIKSAANYGYHRQAAFYRFAYSHHFGSDAEHCHLVVRNQAPYEVAIYMLDEDAIRVGELQVLESLRRLRECRDSGKWSAPWESGFMRLSLPRWASIEIQE